MFLEGIEKSKVTFQKVSASSTTGTGVRIPAPTGSSRRTRTGRAAASSRTTSKRVRPTTPCVSTRLEIQENFKDKVKVMQHPINRSHDTQYNKCNSQLTFHQIKVNQLPDFVARWQHGSKICLATFI